MKKCPFSPCWDSNLQPSKRESHPIISTRPAHIFIDAILSLGGFSYICINNYGGLYCKWGLGDDLGPMGLPIKRKATKTIYLVAFDEKPKNDKVWSIWFCDVYLCKCASDCQLSFQIKIGCLLIKIINVTMQNSLALLFFISTYCRVPKLTL